MARRIEDSLKCFPWLDLAISALKANELEGVKFKNINCQWCVETDIPFELLTCSICYGNKRLVNDFHNISAIYYS